MKNYVSILALGLVVFAAPIAAQDAEPVDEVISRGTIQTDPAMSAFLSGDYATAEVEFQRNAFCALRVTRNFRSGVEDARDSTIRSDVGTDVDVAAQPTGNPGSGGGVAVPTAPIAVPIANINSSDFQRDDSAKKRTCKDRGFQIYMKGMSQLKLGKQAEAKATLSQATNINRQLYDAHFRLALIEYQSGNINAAQKQFGKLQKISKKCKRCNAKAEINGQIQYLKKLLN